MPISDHPPVVVLPDTWEGHNERRGKFREVEDVWYCDRYREDTQVFTDEYARLRGLDASQVKSWEIHGVCRNRDLAGDKRHQWCFRCPAGFAFWAPKAERERPAGTDAPTQARIRV